MHRNPLSALLVAGLLAGASALAQAQPGRPPFAAADGADHPAPAERRQRIERGLAELKTRLAIQPTQEAAWTAWVQAMLPPAQRPQHPTREQLAQLTTPERLDYMQAMQAERAAAMNRRADATRALYAQLTPQQRSIFDAESAARMHGPRFGDGDKPRRHSG